jgi:hypothetical protein
MNETHLPPPVERFETRSLLVGGLAALLLAVGILLNPEQSFRSYLFAYLFWLGIALGSLGLAMVHALVGGGWGHLIRRFLEAAAMTLPALLVLGLPLVFGIHALYPWAHEEEVAHSPVLQHRRPYLNVTFVIVRTAVYFFLWILWAWLVQHWSARLDRGPDRPTRVRLQKFSAVGMLMYVLTTSFASFDWIMSLEPHWYSSMLGFITLTGQGLSAMAFAIVMLVILRGHGPFSDRVQPGHLNDLGSLLFTLVVLFSYVAFSQYLIIWSGHIQEEITYYVQRNSGGWQTLTQTLILLQFFVPFFVLLSRNNKRRPIVLGGTALLVLLMQLLHLFWQIEPAGHDHHPPFRLYWTDFMAPLALGGLWLKVFFWNLRSRPLLPMRRADQPEVLPHGQQAAT